MGNPKNFDEDKKKAYPNKSAIYDVDEDGEEEQYTKWREKFIFSFVPSSFVVTTL